MRRNLLFCFALSVVISKAQIITTVAGGGSINIGDGNTSDSCYLKNPIDVIKDKLGNIYISDQGNHRIRKIDQFGIISTIAGTGIAGFNGDGGPANAAQLNAPAGIVFDTSGNLLIADELNHRVRKIDLSGIINTIAGTGVGGYNADGIPATTADLNKPFFLFVDKLNDLYIADQSNNRIRKINSAGIISTFAGMGLGGFSGDGGQAVSARLNKPSDIIKDTAGNFFIADYNNNRIRKVDPSGIITTLAGSSLGYAGDGGAASLARFHSPMALCFDSVFNLYIADFNNNRIRRIDNAGIINTVVGKGTSGFSGDGGPADSAQINRPAGISIDVSGNLLIADNFNGVIRNVNSSIINTIAGGYADIGNGGLATLAYFESPDGVTFDKNGTMFIPDFYANVIRTVNPSGIVGAYAGTGTTGYSGNGGQAALAQLEAPQSVCLDTSGNIFFADSYNHCVRKIDVSTGIITTVAGTGIAGYNGDGISATTARLNLPAKIYIDKFNTLYIADGFNYRIRKVDVAGIISTIAGTGVAGFTGDSGLATAAKITFSEGITKDAAGNLYFCDAQNNRIRKIDTAGVINTIAGIVTAGFSGDGGPADSAKLSYPGAIVFNSSGELLICDGGNNRIRKIDTAGIINTIVGNGAGTFAGDGGPPLLASIYNPNDIYLDAVGDLYIADFYNKRIRKVTWVNSVSGILDNDPLTIFPNPSSGLLNIRFNHDYTIRISNMLGETIHKEYVSSHPVKQLDLDYLPNGTYILNLDAGQKSVRQKIIICK